VALYEKFNRIPMPDHSDLSDEHIKSIVEFIKAEAESGMVAEKISVVPVLKKSNYVPLSIERDGVFFITFFGCVLLLIGTLLFAVHVKTLERDVT
jgi:hypothetical protein